MMIIIIYEIYTSHGRYVFDKNIDNDIYTKISQGLFLASIIKNFSSKSIYSDSRCF